MNTPSSPTRQYLSEVLTIGFRRMFREVFNMNCIPKSCYEKCFDQRLIDKLINGFYDNLINKLRSEARRVDCLYDVVGFAFVSRARLRCIIGKSFGVPRRCHTSLINELKLMEVLELSGKNKVKII